MIITQDRIWYIPKEKHMTFVRVRLFPAFYFCRHGVWWESISLNLLNCYGRIGQILKAQILALKD